MLRADKAPWIVEGEDNTRSSQESALRAARRLRSARLLNLREGTHPTGKTAIRLRFDEDGEVERYVAIRGPRAIVAELSPLGAEVVRHYKNELEQGKPIRWEKHREAILRGSRLPTAELVAIFGAQVEKWRKN